MKYEGKDFIFSINQVMLKHGADSGTCVCERATMDRQYTERMLIIAVPNVITAQGIASH